jgi:hypothetical protein
MATRMQHCAWCGAELGVYEGRYDEPESCGRSECNREVNAMYREMREDAHERLDRDMGWD